MFADEYANENQTPNTPREGFVSPDARAEASTILAKPMSDKSSCQSNVHSSGSAERMHLGHALGGSTLWNASNSAFQKFKSAFKSFKTVSSPPKTPWIPPAPAPTMPQRPTPHVWRAFGSPYESQDATYTNAYDSFGVTHWHNDLLAASLLYPPPSSNDKAPAHNRVAAKSKTQKKSKSSRNTSVSKARGVVIDLTQTPSEINKPNAGSKGKVKAATTADVSSSSVKIKNKPSLSRSNKSSSSMKRKKSSPGKKFMQTRFKRVMVSNEIRSCFLCQCTSTDHWRRGYDTSTMGKTLCDTCGKRESRRLAKEKVDARKKRTGSPMSTDPSSKRAKR